MPLVQAKCENCGAHLKVDPSLKAAICEHCGAPYIVKDAINYYKTEATIAHAEVVQADTVNIVDETASEGRLKAAEAYMNSANYAQAQAEFTRVKELTPQNHLAWWGLIRSITHEFQLDFFDETTLDELDSYADEIVRNAPDGEYEDKMAIWYNFLAKERKNNEDRITELNSENRKMKIRINDLSSEIKDTSRQMADNEEEWKHVNKLIGENKAAVDKIAKKNPNKWWVSVLLLIFVAAGAVALLFAFGYTVNELDRTGELSAITKVAWGIAALGVLSFITLLFIGKIYNRKKKKDMLPYQKKINEFGSELNELRATGGKLDGQKRNCISEISRLEDEIRKNDSLIERIKDSGVNFDLRRGLRS